MSHLPPTLQAAGPKEASRGPFDSALRGLEHEMICSQLKRTQVNMARAACELGITERILGLRVKEYGINVKRFGKTQSSRPRS